MSPDQHALQVPGACCLGATLGKLQVDSPLHVRVRFAVQRLWLNNAKDWSANMNRTEFLRNCCGGLCACVAAGELAPASSSAADAAPAEDWRLRFVKSRYARLIGILSDKMDEKTLNAALRELGTYCSSSDPRLTRFRGDLEGYRAHIKQTASGDDVAFDPERGVITVTSPERADCFCPLISLQTHTPPVVCNCSLGWHQGTWETVTGKKVQVELKESVLRGGKRCVFQVHVLAENA
jgi:hypothetical protein